MLYYNIRENRVCHILLEQCRKRESRLALKKAILKIFIGTKTRQSLLKTIFFCSLLFTWWLFDSYLNAEKKYFLSKSGVYLELRNEINIICEIILFGY